MASRPIVAIVGRPNVGKSTLFNRLAEERKAIVGDVPGTTRDRIYADAEWTGVPFTLVDTGGLVLWGGDELATQVRRQVEVAMAEAEAIIFMVDVMDGVTPADDDIAHLLHRSRKPVFLAVNKTDNESRRLEAAEFYRLGLGEPHPISAIHGIGVGELLDALVASLPRVEAPEEVEGVRIAIVGRPNVGKSSLLNSVLGWERAIVATTPGTTRDAIDTDITWAGESVTLIDTAGIRRRGRIQKGIEHYSLLRALRAIQRSNVVLLLLDAPEGVTAQDTHIAGYALEEGKGIVLVVNKWDLMGGQDGRGYLEKVKQAFNFIPYAPVLFASAATGEGVGKIIETALKVHEERQRRVPTAGLNKALQEAMAGHPPSSKAGKRLRFYYVTQIDVAPPTFIFFVNDPQILHFSYRRYLENKWREAFGFQGTPLRFVFKKRDRRLS